jgi:hypothetical protein
MFNLYLILILSINLSYKSYLILIEYLYNLLLTLIKTGSPSLFLLSLFNLIYLSLYFI